jgi:lipopolysaccharide transport protein LptA
MEFQGQVEIVEPKRRAAAEAGRFLEKDQALSLSGGARLADEAEGSDLQADAIDVQGGAGSGKVAARGNVRHVVTARGARRGPFGDGRGFQASAGSFDYDGRAKTARYREEAVLRAGDDEVRGDLIVMEETEAGRRRLSASGQVRTQLQARGGAASGEAGGPARKPIETESAEMLYEEARRTVVYRGKVRIRQGEVVTLSPEATAHLTADGAGVEKVVAGEPVEVWQGERRARGTRGTYTPDRETMVLVGDEVVLEDRKQKVVGRSLTFHARDDTILVDGREVERTESVFRREPRKP